MMAFGAKAESVPLWAGGLSACRVDGLPSETPEGSWGTPQVKCAQGSGHHWFVGAAEFSRCGMLMYLRRETERAPTSF